MHMCLKFILCCCVCRGQKYRKQLVHMMFRLFSDVLINGFIKIPSVASEKLHANQKQSMYGISVLNNYCDIFEIKMENSTKKKITFMFMTC